MQKLQQQRHWESWVDEFFALYHADPKFTERLDVKTGGCFLWLGYVSPSGYGYCAKGKAHRHSYTVANGPIQKGMVIGHICDQRNCVRPSHLVACTQKENVHDAWAKGRARQGSYPGELNPSAKLNKEAINEMKALKADGWTYRMLSEKFGVAQSNAYNAVVGKSFTK